MPSSASWILLPPSPCFLLRPNIYCADEKEPRLGVWKSTCLTVGFLLLGERKEKIEVQCDSFRNKSMEDSKELNSLPKHDCIK